MKLKISPTLLDALEWYNNAPETWKEKAYKDIVSKLNRAPFVATEAILRGQRFEAAVQKIAQKIDAGEGGPVPGSAHFQRVVNQCLGAQWQQWKKAYLTIDGVEVEMIGKLDVYWPIGDNLYPNGHIIDLKTTGAYRGEDKYKKGWQHKFYCQWTSVPTFTYVVAEWVSDSGNDIKAIHTIDCQVEIATATQVITDGIKGFFAFLKTNNLWSDYVYTYSKNAR